MSAVSVVPQPHRKTAAPVTTRHPDLYAPGPIRQASDRGRSAVVAFTKAHPEFARLSDDEVIQAMSTYRTAEEHAERERAYGDGVPRHWRRSDDGGIDDSLGRY